MPPRPSLALALAVAVLAGGAGSRADAAEPSASQRGEQAERHAQLPQPEELVRRLAERYASLDTLSARFVQTYRSAAIGTDLEESGRLWVKRPLLRWDHEEPDHKVFLVDADGRALSYVPADRTAVRGPLPERAPHLELLLGRGDVLDDFAVAEVVLEEPRDPRSRQLRLVPRRPLAGVDVVYLEVAPDASALARVVVVDELGNVTDLVLEDVRENRPIRDRVFDARLPKTVTVREAGEDPGGDAWRR